MGKTERNSTDNMLYTKTLHTPMEKVQLARNLDQREIVATKRNCQPFAARYTIFVCRYTIFVCRYTIFVY